MQKEYPQQKQEQIGANESSILASKTSEDLPVSIPSLFRDEDVFETNTSKVNNTVGNCLIEEKLESSKSEKTLRNKLVQAISNSNSLKDLQNLDEEEADDQKKFTKDIEANKRASYPLNQQKESDDDSDENTIRNYVQYINQNQENDNECKCASQWAGVESSCKLPLNSQGEGSNKCADLSKDSNIKQTIAIQKGNIGTSQNIKDDAKKEFLGTKWNCLKDKEHENEKQFMKLINKHIDKAFKASKSFKADISFPQSKSYPNIQSTPKPSELSTCLSLPLFLEAASSEPESGPMTGGAKQGKPDTVGNRTRAKQADSRASESGSRDTHWLDSLLGYALLITEMMCLLIILKIDYIE